MLLLRQELSCEWRKYDSQTLRHVATISATSWPTYIVRPNCQTSTSVFGTEVYPHMPILRPHAARFHERRTSITWRLRRRISTVMFTYGWAWLTCWQIRPILGFWGSKFHKNARFPALYADETPCKIWRRYLYPRRIHKQTNKQAHEQTVTDTSTPCLSACVDKTTFKILPRAATESFQYAVLHPYVQWMKECNHVVVYYSVLLYVFHYPHRHSRWRRAFSCVCLSVCLSVCSRFKRKTAWAIDTKLCTRILLYSIAVFGMQWPIEFKRSKIKVGHTVTKTVTVARLLVTHAAMAVAGVGLHVDATALVPICVLYCCFEYKKSWWYWWRWWGLIFCTITDLNLDIYDS